MDPQQRIFLERGYAALHTSGCTKGAVLGSGAGVALVPRTGGSASVELTAASIFRRAASRSFKPDRSRSSIGGSRDVLAGAVGFADGAERAARVYVASQSYRTERRSARKELPHLSLTGAVSLFLSAFRGRCLARHAPDLFFVVRGNSPPVSCS